MKTTLKHYGKCINGVLKFYNEILWQQQKATLNGCDFELVIKEKNRRPTLDEHAYYRGAILATCYESIDFSHFDTAEDIHKEFFQPKFLSYKKVVEVGNDKFEITQYRSTSSLTAKEMADFIEKVLAWCSLNNIIILSPEQYEQKYYRTITKKKSGKAQNT